jgi:signal transduction histidine kinase
LRIAHELDHVPAAHHIVQAICEDREGALWFGADNGLVRYRNGVATSFTTRDGLAGDDVKVIIEGAAGTLWIGAYGGLTCLKDGKFTAYTERDGLPSNSVRALYEDRDGVLWIGTYDGGLGRLKGGRFTRYTTREGLFNDGVFQILEDARGNFWMSSNRGIQRVRKQELDDFAEGKQPSINSIAYGKSDGMLNAECNGGRWPAGIRARDGRLWFPTQDGAAVIEPETMRANPQPPSVLIESVLLDREPAPIAPQLRAVRVTPDKENVEIVYTALSFINSELIRFKYKLEGLDHDWTDVGTRRSVYYPHIPPGDYVFKVIAANSDGVWNTEGQSLRIVVLPPFYRTWWFGLLSLVALAGAATLAYRYRIRQFQQLQRAQQKFSQQLIESQEAERKRVAAELHDNLGQHLVVIKNLALMFLQKQVNGDARQVEDISATASQAISEVKEISYNLRPYQLDRIGLAKAIEALLKKAEAASGIRFVAAIDDLGGALPKESEINFYRIVQECLNNILKHSQATEATVTIRRSGDRLRMTIRDNGKGFTPGVAAPGAHGFGLLGINERAQLLGGQAGIHSAPGQGATTTLEIALSQGGAQNGR